MNSSLTFEEWDELRGMLRVDRNVSKADVLKALANVSRRIKERLPHSFLDQLPYAATEWLRYAYRHRELTWENLAALLRHNVDYISIYREVGTDPVFEEHSSLWDEWHHGSTFEHPDDYIDIIKKELGEGRFIEVVRFVADALIEKEKRGGDGVSKHDALLGKSIDHWLHPNDPNRYRADGKPSRSEDSHSAGAKIYEAELLTDKTFIKELEETCSKIDALLSKQPGIEGKRGERKRMHWDFAVSPDSGRHHFTHYFWADEPRDKAFDWEHINERAYIENPPHCLPAFCSRWSLSGVSTMFGSAGRNGLFITARRIRVDRSSEGVTTFIPRYYRFSDIDYRDVDFAPLKRALDDSYSKLRLQKSVRALIEEAIQYRQHLVAQGKSRAEAWETTRKYMGWSESTMAKRLGEKTAKERSRHRRKDARVVEFLLEEEKQQLKEKRRIARARKSVTASTRV